MVLLLDLKIGVCILALSYRTVIAPLVSHLDRKARDEMNTGTELHSLRRHEEPQPHLPDRIDSKKTRFPFLALHWVDLRGNSEYWMSACCLSKALKTF